MTKEELRKSMLKRLLDEKQVCPQPLNVSTQMLLAFIPLRTEVDISKTIDKALSDGINVAVPMQNPGVFSFIYDGWREDIVKQENGVYIPSHDDCFLLDSLCLDVTILVPGLAFTNDGKRLGRGAGFYDRVLSVLYEKKNIEVTSIGICRDFQIIDCIPCTKEDLSVGSVMAF